jgi:hypothetical protein
VQGIFHVEGEGEGQQPNGEKDQHHGQNIRPE